MERKRGTKQKVTRNNLKEGPWTQSCGLNSDVLNSITSWRESHNSPGNVWPSSLDDICCTQRECQGTLLQYLWPPAVPVSGGSKWEWDRYDDMKNTTSLPFLPLSSEQILNNWSGYVSLSPRLLFYQKLLCRFGNNHLCSCASWVSCILNDFHKVQMIAA